MTEQIQQVPRSIDKEMALLGALLIDPKIIDQVSVSADAFYSEAHKAIFRAMRGLGSQDMDALTLAEVLGRKGKLDEIGGEMYLLELSRSCPNTYNWEAWEKIIKDDYIRRQIIDLAGTMAALAMNMNENINKSIADVISNIARTAEPLKGTMPIKDYVMKLYDKLEDLSENPREIFGLKTGIPDFDKITHGMQKRETVILAGVPGCGKSILGFQIACGMAENGHPGCVYELEMSIEAALRRKLSGYSRIQSEKLRTGKGLDRDWEMIIKALEKMADLPISISDDSAWDPVTLRADLARRKIHDGIEWFLIDYMDLVNAPGYTGHEKSEYLSQQIHGIAKDLDLSGLIIHSLNKQGFTNVGMHTLSGSHKVSYDADQIISIAPDKETFGLVTLTWEKYREAESNRKLKMIMPKGIPEFSPVAKDDQTSPINDWTV